MSESENIIEQVESPKMLKLRQDLVAWLNSDSSDELLISWLKGYALPALGYEDAPYDWIMRALNGLPSEINYRIILSQRIADFLERETPYQNSPTDDRLLFNIFYLCANLNRKQELASPLEKAFNFFQEHENAREEFFAENNPYNLNASFREALIYNQVSDKYLPFWKEILEQNQPNILRGNIFSGLLGVLHASQNDQPFFNEIGWALGKMAEYFDQTHDKNGHFKFRQLIERVKKLWDGYEWDKILLAQTIKHGWQRWATVRLDNLVIPYHRATDVTRHYLIWNAYVPFLKEFDLNIKKITEKDILSEIEVSDEEAIALESKLYETERIRLRVPYKSYENVAQATREFLYMSLCEEDDYTDNEALTHIRIRTYTIAAENQDEKVEREVKAQKALFQTASSHY